jgi:antitoxin PrlF
MSIPAAEDRTSTVPGYVLTPNDQAWFFTPVWLAGEQEAEDEIAAGHGTQHKSTEDMFNHLSALGSSDAWWI